MNGFSMHVCGKKRYSWHDMRWYGMVWYGVVSNGTAIDLGYTG